MSFERFLYLAYTVLYGVAFVFYLLYFLSPKKVKAIIPRSILLFAFGVHTLFIIVRWYDAGHAPLQTLYEAISWFAWSAIIAYIIVEWRRHVYLAGVIVLPVVLGSLIFAYTKLPYTTKPLPPALQSYWFEIHVMGAFASYAYFVIAFAVEVVYLILRPIVKGGGGTRYDLDLKKLERFHVMAYNLILFGFPFLTFGIFSGAAWAEDAWGGYWAWDPKETWSLITWLIFAGYLHAKVTPKLGRGFASFLNILGFVAMIFTFLGVNWLAKILGIPSLHTYAF